MPRALTRKGEQTRARIVAGAAAEVRERGVDEVRLDDVMGRTGTSKGQIFHYFPDGREELLLAVAQHEADQVLADQEPALSDLTTWPAWQEWRDLVVARYRAQGMSCPLSTLLGPTGRRGPGSQAVVAGLMTRWQARITAGVRQMQATGQIAAGLDADRVGSALLASIQGGVLLMLSTGRIDHLEAALDFALDGLRASAPTITGR
ncbi:TetR/AcrR family transcriptional regulator [Verrucosispora sp. NA02020]|uniref:TetR/AcrR family transcriptional regulator n=1 Tax=Verrucosispora sp. NA02020 TaxID=2742132 RepID=UPI003D70EBA6